MIKLNLINYMKYVLLIVVISASTNIKADIGGDFTLKDQHNNDFTLSNSSNTKIVFFGFLNCLISATALSGLKTIKKIRRFIKKYRSIS